MTAGDIAMQSEESNPVPGSSADDWHAHVQPAVARQSPHSPTASQQDLGLGLPPSCSPNGLRASQKDAPRVNAACLCNSPQAWHAVGPSLHTV